MASDHIPEDLLLEILKRLSIKTVCRFRSVCKSWSSLISSVYFSNTHRTFHSASTNEPKTYLSQDYNHCILHREEDNSSRILANLEFPVLPYHRLYKIALSDVIHGVVFYKILALYTESREKKRWVRQSIIFWNPIVRRHVSAPLPRKEIKDSRHLLGAGYDARSNDLKAVWVPRFKKDGGNEVGGRYYRVFSARAGAWKRREWTLGGGAAAVIKKGYGGCYFDGAVYWVTDRDEVNGHALLYFNCESEEFGRMELPEEIRDVFGNPRLIANGTSSLSLLVTESVFDIDMRFSCRLWTMKEYGVWTNDSAVRCNSSSKSEESGCRYLHFSRKHVVTQYWEAF